MKYRYEPVTYEAAKRAADTAGKPFLEFLKALHESDPEKYDKPIEILQALNSFSFVVQYETKHSNDE